jgi:hypothetical protein
MKSRAISITSLRAHPKRDNQCPLEVQAKIQRHMARHKQYEPLIVYADPVAPNVYTIINGHVRWEIAQALGWAKMDCLLWEVSPAEAELALATLNTLRGTPDPQKRMDLLASLKDQFPVEDLQLLLPESMADFEDLLALQALDQEKQEQAFQEALQAEVKTLPVTLTFVVMPEEKVLIEEALALSPEPERSAALVALCKARLAVCHA